MTKLNCWEVMLCGREVGGVRAAECGPCPAALEARLDGVHGGKNGGRACWGVPKTFCGDQQYDSVADKNARCRECVFHTAVRFDEGSRFMTTMALMRLVREAVN